MVHLFVGLIASRSGALHADIVVLQPAQARLPKPYSVKASPLIAGDRVHLATEEGDPGHPAPLQRFDQTSFPSPPGPTRRRDHGGHTERDRAGRA